MRGAVLSALMFSAALVATGTVWPADSPSVMAIILDDLGEQQIAGVRAVNLPGAVACAFLPHAPHSQTQAERAYRTGKEVLLHLPLQPGDGVTAYPGAITLAMGRHELAVYLRSALASVPHVRGINNHQGSLLTEMPQNMDWLMMELRQLTGLYFVDSRTSSDSVALHMAQARGVPATERSLFLDHPRGEAAVRAALHTLVTRARREGGALAIGHPYPETLKVLEEELPHLARQGVRLVAPSELIARQAGRWPEYKPLKFSPTLQSAPRTTGPVLPAASSVAAH
ncbi:MAG: divergent polysaccharide deacetylase family protein [Nevskiales bacterium]|nr:divergent polysaccharide deacetylase family protein [Nevskiales bacterium]